MSERNKRQMLNDFTSLENNLQSIGKLLVLL